MSLMFFGRSGGGDPVDGVGDTGGFEAEPNATLPQSFVTTTYSLPTGGTTYTPANAAALATDLASATYGDVIQLTAGIDYGNITLPNKGAGSDWIYIVSANLGSLPAAGTRVGTGDRTNMPILSMPDANTEAVGAANGAHHYRFVGINLVAYDAAFSYSVVQFGIGTTSTANLPADIIFDRCLVEGDATFQTRRGIWLNVVRGAVVDCYLHNFRETGADTQSILISNTPGPCRIHGNFMEAAGEVMMCGGADPTITNCVPSDIEITDNYFFKRLSWFGTDPVCKNSMEWKNAQRVLFEGNLIENNWSGGQNGFTILVTPRNQEGGAAWSVTQDITIRYNVLLNASSGISIAGDDDTFTINTKTNRIVVRDNVFHISGLDGTGDSAVNRGLAVYSGASEGQFSNNITINDTGEDLYDAFIESSPVADDWLIENNIFGGNQGFAGTATGDGNGTLGTWFSNLVFRYNLCVSSNSSVYTNWTDNNAFPANMTAVGFTDAANDDYSLAGGSSYKNAGQDGTDPGPDWAQLSSRGLV